MIGSTVSHDRILDKFGEGSRRKYLLPPSWGSLRQASIKTIPPVLNPDTEQPGHIKHHAEFLQLTKLLRGERQWIQNDGKKSSESANQSW